MSFRAQVQIDTVKSLAGAIAAGGALATLANSALDLSDGEIDQKEAPAAYEVAYITTASPAPTVTTQREYVWGPGDRGIYELVMQFDASASRVWVMQDEGGDVCGAADGSGFSGAARLLGAWSYGPYGEVIKDASVAGVTLSPIHAGHKGLFVDRLDVGVATPAGIENPRLGTGATQAVYANNRTLLPKIGRWCQADPNASGLVSLTMASAGYGLRPRVDVANFEMMWPDGANSYQYLSSSTWTRHDPLGLWGEDWWRDTKDGADLLWNGYLTISAFTDVHGFVQSMAEELTTEYSSNLEYDSDWAEDWSVRDDVHTRLSDRWVRMALVRAFYRHFNLEYWRGDFDGGQQYAMAGMEFPAWVKRLSPDLELHHIATWYKRFGRRMEYELQRAGLSLRHAANALPLVGHVGPHDPAYHEWLLRKLRECNRRGGTLVGRHREVRRFLWETGEKIRQGLIDPNDFKEP